MNKKVAISQSNYIPWKGYFDLINQVDLFVFYDDVKYTKNDWRNRNKIKTPNGLKWLTLPCGYDFNRLICDVKLQNQIWQQKHWEILRQNYSNAPYFNTYQELFKNVYLKKKWTYLSELNQHLIKLICNLLEIKTDFEDSRNYNLKGAKEERVVDLLKKVNATEYLSGPAAKTYLSEETFLNEKIELIWMDYSNYKKYNQLYPPFVHEVSIVDLLFNEGENAKNYLNLK